MKLHAACALLMIGLPLLTAAGCSAGASSATPESAEAGALAEEAGAVAPADAGTDSSTGQSPSGELKIVSLSTTVSTVTGGNPTSTESAGVTFVAIVTDAHGLDSIAGGQLIDKDGRTYAAFGAGSNKGTFAATIDFAAMNTVRAIDFEGTKTDSHLHREVLRQRRQRGERTGHADPRIAAPPCSGSSARAAASVST